MYTTSSLSKHTTSLSPNQFLRPQRDVSPSSNLSRHPPSHKSKYYSTDEVSRMIKSYIEPKILYLKNELQQKNRVIQLLNQKLDENDGKLTRLYNYAQSMTRKQKQSQQQLLSQQQSNTILQINQLLNDRLKQYWQIVNEQIDRIKQQFREQTRMDSKQIQARIQQQLQNIKRQTTEYIDQSRVKNNSYWLKIKQALNRINSKVNKIDETLATTLQQYDANQLSIKQHIQHIQQMHNSKQTVKKLIELKKSVQNIYQNYSNLLELQNMLKNRIDEVGKGERKMGGVMVRERDEESGGLFDSFEDVGYVKRGDGQFGAVNNGGNTFPMFKKKQFTQNQQQQFSTPFKTQQDFNPLQPTYSSINQKQPIRSQSNSYKQNDSIDRHLTDENFVLEYSRDDNGSEVFGSNLGSGVVMAERHQELSSGKQFNTKYFVPTYSTNNKNKSNNSGILTNELSPIKSTPSQTSKLQHGMHSPTDLSCLNSSVAALRQGTASRSTSFVNLSLENRNQMSESVRQRLEQIIELKNLPKPLIVYVDQINYLKNSQGNYIFDTRGNMFKVNVQEGRELQKMGIVQFIDKGVMPGGSNIKKREPNNSNQLLDKLTIPESIRSKSINTTTRIKSIILRERDNQI